MATRSYTSRRELEQHSFSPAVAVLVPLGAILLQALLPKPFPRLAILDLPLIVTVFFAVSRRNPVAGTLTGGAIGLLQDALTAQPIGVNGMAKSVIGYIAASIGVQIDVEPHDSHPDQLWILPAQQLPALPDQSPSSWSQQLSHRLDSRTYPRGDQHRCSAS